LTAALATRRPGAPRHEKIASALRLPAAMSAAEPLASPAAQSPRAANIRALAGRALAVPA
jgi:hypothetical protein